MSDAILIDPVRDLGEALLGVEKPARYTGGEYGILASPGSPFQTAIAFPDLYEIGMSNQALRILYNRLNAIPGVSCDRVFAPAPDFETLLRKRPLPLYGLDTGIPLGKLDLLLFTLGYELGITSVLTMLDLAGISIHREQRGEGDPVVIMGGPCVSNPLPYSAFIDAFWIGEAEAGFFELVTTLADLKGEGEGREGILRVLRGHPHIWVQGKEEALRAVDYHFAERPVSAAVFPVPSMKVVQHHGAVEIMRGCPNGCRFCHAGYWYRPMRQKSAEQVMKEAEEFIRKGGYREISLSSLSTGDYCGIADLVEDLNLEFGGRKISFQLPSLKVSTFSLPLLKKISEVRRSGITFAVETPEDAWQLSINKEVSLKSITAILREAKKNGWKGAKFYFMIGLPVGNSGGGGEESEEQAIVDFVLAAARETGAHFSINVGTFVPKPHTPYQREAQLGEDLARRKLYFIRDRLKSRGHKVGIQDPFISTIEGIISRGDERVGEIIEEVWKKGCRLDAWNEYLKKEIWQEVLRARHPLPEEILAGRGSGLPLPWDHIKLGISPNFFTAEYNKSCHRELTSPCIEKCTHPCGICGVSGKIVKNSIHRNENPCAKKSPEGIPDCTGSTKPSRLVPVSDEKPGRDPPVYRILFSFFKEKQGVFYSHLTVVEILSMTMVRSGIPVSYTAGFNPLPRLEIASPLAVGISAGEEIAVIETEGFFDAREFRERMNPNLPLGLGICKTCNLLIPSGEKKYSLSGVFWGGLYENTGGKNDLVAFRDEKKYRLGRAGSGASSWGLRRLAVFAGEPGGEPGTPKSYFEVFEKLYPWPGH